MNKSKIQCLIIDHSKTNAIILTCKWKIKDVHDFPVKATAQHASIIHYKCWKEIKLRCISIFVRTCSIPALAFVILIRKLCNFLQSLHSFKKDTIHPILKLQCSPTNDPFPNNVRVLFWFGLCFLAFLHRSFLEPYRDTVYEEREDSNWGYFWPSTLIDFDGCVSGQW